MPILPCDKIPITGRGLSASYLVTAYYSAAILVPDALGVLDGVQVV